MPVVAPSLLSADLFQLGNQIEQIAATTAEYLHVDIMDGHYVPNINFGDKIVGELRQHTELTLDCHIMVDQPEQVIHDVAVAGGDILTFHPETSDHPYRQIQEIHRLGKKAGIAFDPGTAISTYADLLPIVDQVLVMTVSPGFGGQKFLPEMLNKIAQVKRIQQANQYQFDIEVDGGINDQTGQQCVNAGANVLVAGSYVFKNGITPAIMALSQLQQE
ncbi:ribulose-phosphate 3-epimerase [Lapidilactobacillus gannanensis]|uniref:Ribulose-phosphate 3-epimerase n=1 Tax=Lapidilactobacillus gannanensis TaxID=2486002 RepID=A0ABW4BK25_9LACO|nr:ribulose-phosphate 3-epimerase [Lapidilactobacillus gannanensis]